MFFKPYLTARSLWALVTLASVCFIISLTVQLTIFSSSSPFSSSYNFLPFSAKKTPACLVDKLLGDPWGYETPKEHVFGIGWKDDPYEGLWSNVPSKEDYEVLMSEEDKTMMREELYKYSDDLQRDKRARVENFYALKTSDDWGHYIEGHSDEGLAPLTKFTQRYLRRHQHPENCTGKAFLVFRKFPNDESFGLGALAQSIAHNLALAIRTNRILVYDAHDPPGAHFLSPPPGAGRTLDNIFHPLSSCTPADVAASTDKVYFPWEPEATEIYYRTHPASLPPVLAQVFKTQFADMNYDAIRYWWRGQVAAFAMRPNRIAMERLKELRVEDGLNKGVTLQKGKHPMTGIKLGMPWPLPVGAWSMHVRHGDKGIEMSLVELKKYVMTAEEHIIRNPQSSRRIAFISTEDPSVLYDARNISSLLPMSTSKGWEWYWSDIPRFNGGPVTQLEKFGNRTEMTIKWFLQLTMALECDNFVGTRGSGWNRLIDELRCIWYPSCKSGYVEVGSDSSWAHYGL